ncbi:MAG TPA: HAD hydrolase-like protein [Candidatus Babeliales bacterium]|nr:HAD hydrolase-like protein [Candidatus Babeliales bacterium]
MKLSMHGFKLAIGLIAAIDLSAAHIIFDFDGVLAESNRRAVLWEVLRAAGPTHLLGAYNPFSVESTFLKFLSSIEKRHQDTPLAFYNNKPLPQIMCDWMCGTKTTQEIRHIIEKALAESSKYSSHKTLFKALSTVLFTPMLFVRGIAPIKDGIKLFKKCASMLDEDGNRIHKLYILSNWDAESFKLLAQLEPFEEIISLCTGIIISGDVHLMKPDIRIFECLFNKYDINPHKELTIFIDDQRINIAAARELNKRQLHAFLCENAKFKSIKKEMKKLGVI